MSAINFAVKYFFKFLGPHAWQAELPDEGWDLLTCSGSVESSRRFKYILKQRYKIQVEH